MPDSPERVDLAIVGTGAAGLMAAIWGGRTAAARGRPRRIIALDGAVKIGAKILVAGGGRCNVTHNPAALDESDYAGSSRHAIKQVLRAFDAARTVAFFRELGVELKREETGKLFPVTDDAHTVLNALLAEARRVGVELRYPWRVESISRTPDGFLITRAPPTQDSRLGTQDSLLASRLILATGGKALPRSGSDGHGYTLARALGHTVTPRVFPALVPLTLAEGSFVRGLSGLTLPTTLCVCSSTGKRLVSCTNSTLCTHFGLSGPSVLDISRYYLDARAADPGATLRINWLPTRTIDQLDAALRDLRTRSPARLLADPPYSLPDRLARALCEAAGVAAGAAPEHLERSRRRALAVAVCDLTLPVTGDRGFTHAEATAGGVPLAELHLSTMESRLTPGLHVIGEVCDVDGRVGGFNFQWAWSSGHVAGIAV